MIDSDTMGCPEQKSAGCKTKWQKQNGRQIFQGQISFFQQMKAGTSVIPHFHVILTGQSISGIIFMI